MKGNKNMTKSKETLKAFVGEVINEMIHNNDNWVKMFGLLINNGQRLALKLLRAQSLQQLFFISRQCTKTKKLAT